MFKKLKLKILLIVTSIFTIGTILISIVSYLSLKSIIYYNFKNLSEKSFSQKIDDLSMYMKLIEESSKLLSQNNSIINILTNANSDSDTSTSVSSTLNIMDTSYPGILGVALVDNSGREYRTQNITSYPTLDDLKKIYGFSQFLLSANLSYWSVRNNFIPGYYGQINHEGKQGSITFITKISDKRHMYLGLLCIDIDMNYIYNLVSNSDRSSAPASNVCILNKNSILSSNNTCINSKEFKQYMNLYHKSDKYINVGNQEFLVLCNNLKDNKIILSSSVSSLKKDLNIMLILLAVICFILIVISIVIGILLSNSIAVPLVRLYKKMAKSN